MSQYPAALHPADNNALRLLYRGLFPMIQTAVKYPDGRFPSIWVLRNTPENLARYNDLFNSNNPPRPEAETLERAGATFFPAYILPIVLGRFNIYHLFLLLTFLAIEYQCETKQFIVDLTTGIAMAFQKIPKTVENLRLAKKS